jgi:hypothetical protein
MSKQYVAACNNEGHLGWMRRALWRVVIQDCVDDDIRESPKRCDASAGGCVKRVDGQCDVFKRRKWLSLGPCGVGNDAKKDWFTHVMAKSAQVCELRLKLKNLTDLPRNEA